MIKKSNQVLSRDQTIISSTAKGYSQKKTKNSKFEDIVQIGGREGGQPHFKKLKRDVFLTKVGEGGGHKTHCQK